MAERGETFDYLAIDQTGRRVRGSIAASTENGAFDALRRDGLSPLKLRAARNVCSVWQLDGRLSDREVAEFLSNLAALLGAGTDMRTALRILGARIDRQSVRNMAQTLEAQISSGRALDEVFAGQLGRSGRFVAALVAPGDIAGGLQRASDMLQSRVRIRDQLITVLSYPVFIFVSTIGALAVIIIFVAPSLAPLVTESGGHAPLVLGLMIVLSQGLHENKIWIWIGGAIATVALLLAGRLGVLGRIIDRILLEGPLRRTAAGLLFGSFAIALGNMLIAGAPTSEALRLAARSVPSGLARAYLEPVVQAVRQGQSLSAALGSVKCFPDMIVRLAAVGEITGSLGSMLSKAGKLEEDAAIRRIEAISRFLGPALIVGLGAVIGLMMGGLLTGVSQLGESALQ